MNNPLLLAAVLPFLAGAALGCGQSRVLRAGELRGTILDSALPKPRFTLSSTSGEPFDFRRETDGFVTLLFFGYTHCPDVCPLHMANIGAVLHKLPPRVTQRVKVVFVSVDPMRDSAAVIRRWLDNFHPSFVGLLGAPDTVAGVLAALHLPRSVVPHDAAHDADYLVGHPAAVVAFTPDDSARVLYPFGTRQADWAHDLPRLVDGRWGQDRP